MHWLKTHCLVRVSSKQVFTSLLLRVWSRGAVDPEEVINSVILTAEPQHYNVGASNQLGAHAANANDASQLGHA